MQFGSDVVVDLIGYRRHGHSEVDDPTITQPLLYKAIKDHPPLWQIYAEDIGIEDAADAGADGARGTRSCARTAQDNPQEDRAARACRRTGRLQGRPLQAGIRSGYRIVRGRARGDQRSG